jgi:PelD GGDEF domain
MVVRALESGYQVHLQDTLMESAPSNQLIAATPLISSERQPFGLVAVGSMPFASLTTDNLQTIAVLIESYSDYLRLSLNASEILHQWPDAPRGLSGEFAWLSRLFNEFGLASRCVIWRVQHPREQMLGEVLQLHSRGETAWRWPLDRTSQRGHPCVIALVPFTDAAGVRIYKQRIFDSMDRHFGDLGADQLNAFDFALGRENSFARLRWLVEGDKKDDKPTAAPAEAAKPKKATP